MNRKILIFFIGIIVIGSIATYYYLYKRFQPEIITLAPDKELTRKKPEERGGIVIPNSDSLVYEKLQFGVKKNRKINILPDPEEPILIDIQNEDDDAVISLDAIDQILSNSEYYDLYTDDEATNNIDEYVIPNILKNQPVEIVEEDEDNKIIVANSSLNIIKSNNEKLNFHSRNVVPNQSDGYKIQLSVASTQTDASIRWQKIVNNHSKILGDANLITKKIEGTNRRIFYMIMAGTYPSLNHAKLVCRRLISRKQNCIVTK